VELCARRSFKIRAEAEGLSGAGSQKGKVQLCSKNVWNLPKRKGKAAPKGSEEEFAVIRLSKQQRGKGEDWLNCRRGPAESTQDWGKGSPIASAGQERGSCRHTKGLALESPEKIKVALEA